MIAPGPLVLKSLRGSDMEGPTPVRGGLAKQSEALGQPIVRRITRVVIGSIVMLALGVPTGYAGDVERHAGETIGAYAKRLLPPTTELSTRPVEVNLGALGKATVLLFIPSKGVANYTGWVLVPSSAAATDYKRYVLPPLKVVDGIFEIDVKSVFAADVDGDGSPDLCVLASFYRDGSGDEPYTTTDCFGWTSSRFHLIDTAPQSVGLKNAAAVRSHFTKKPMPRSNLALP